MSLVDDGTSEQIRTSQIIQEVWLEIRKTY